MESEFRDIDERKAWALTYQEIGSASAKYNYSYKDAKKLENKELNRYRDVSPYDHSRIKLKRSSIDYINACMVKVTEANRAYILTQGPLGCTTGHFWLMIWEQNCRAVLMLNRIIEKNVVKCYQYWPTSQDKNSEVVYENVGLKVKFIEKKVATYFVVTKLELTDLESEVSREILHFHYTTWPDFGVPQSPAAFLNFLLAVREANALDKDVGPAVIHCSAGIGRSGTFCLVDSCLVMCEKQKKNLETGKIKQVLLDMRKYRMGLIQTPEQLRFSYVAIIEGAKRLLSSASVDTENNHMMKIVENGFCESSSEEESSNSLPIPPIPLLNSKASSDSQNNFQIINSSSSDAPNVNEIIPNNCGNTLTTTDKIPDENKGAPASSDLHIHSSTPQRTNISSSCLVSEDSPDTSKITSSIGQQSTYSIKTSSEKSEVNENTVPSSKSASENSTSETVMRKRKRQEKIDKTNEKIQEMKAKQKKCETWQKRRRLLFHPVSIGLVVLIGTGIMLYRYM